MISGTGVIIDCVSESFTETTHLYFFFSVFAVMVVLPFRIAVTLPFLLTFATFGLDDFHFTPDFAPFNRRVCFSDTFSVMRFLLILTFASILDDIINAKVKTETSAVNRYFFFLMALPPMKF